MPEQKTKPTEQDVDTVVLEKLVEQSVSFLKKKYGSAVG
jgi:hypothetical protein